MCYFQTILIFVSLVVKRNLIFIIWQNPIHCSLFEFLNIFNESGEIKYAMSIHTSIQRLCLAAGIHLTLTHLLYLLQDYIWSNAWLILTTFFDSFTKVQINHNEIVRVRASKNGVHNKVDLGFFCELIFKRIWLRHFSCHHCRLTTLIINFFHCIQINDSFNHF